MRDLCKLRAIPNWMDLHLKKKVLIDFPLFLLQRGQGSGMLSVCEDNPVTIYRNRVLLVGSMKYVSDILKL